MKILIYGLVIVIVGIVAIFLALFSEHEKLIRNLNTPFTLEEWQTLGEIYDREIKEMGGVQFQNIKGLEDLDKRLDAIILKNVKDKDKEYRELVEYLINKKHGNTREN